ncbi:GNAT family N-acetyltransferase [Pedobacter nyackensis]|uniref:Ribosomal protein S18 acetylase RimI n=1 Tax=Pedobacter nyackensis TaxID=475255 RepID=A0A1W2A2E1_9SPHI|nr:GNAT family N-acetyltransferase [Pedobacter nyackensis]SMC54622.1 Ribosomal protein S18 acetylase RimI [Pedobacter nyackensis]
MKFRIADLSDIAQMQVVRHLVKENTLSDPNLVPDKDVAYYITEKGKGWVAEIDGTIVGFSILDLQDKSVWALFVDPVHAEKGIGKELHRLMIEWYFSQTDDTIVLGTAPNTRAERFYALQGWKNLGSYSNGETKFELTFKDWTNRRA